MTVYKKDNYKDTITVYKNDIRYDYIYVMWIIGNVYLFKIYKKIT